MTDSLLQGYLPLFVWAGLGILLVRVLPDSFPRFLGRSLYWVGIPLEILALARRTEFSSQLGIVPLVAIVTLVVGLGLAWLTLNRLFGLDQNLLKETENGKDQQAAKADDISPISEPLSVLSWPQQGSFLISSVIGNTGFVGLAIVPSFISAPYLSWVVVYGVTHNIVGTYGIGVLLASYFGRQESYTRRWKQLRDILTVPSLWAFVIGTSTQAIVLPAWIESGLQAAVWIVIPVALLLMGMRVSQLRRWKSLQLAIGPAILKTIILPGLVGLVVTGMGLTGDARLALVLMSGMPTAFAGLILAEEYELDRELIASSIVLSTGLLLLTMPLWLWLFGTSPAQ